MNDKWRGMEVILHVIQNNWSQDNLSFAPDSWLLTLALVMRRRGWQLDCHSYHSLDFVSLTDCVLMCNNSLDLTFNISYSVSHLSYRSCFWTFPSITESIKPSGKMVQGVLGSMKEEQSMSTISLVSSVSRETWCLQNEINFHFCLRFQLSSSHIKSSSSFWLVQRSLVDTLTLFHVSKAVTQREREWESRNNYSIHWNKRKESSRIPSFHVHSLRDARNNESLCISILPFICLP